MAVTYKHIKAILAEGGSPSVALIDEAIQHKVADVAKVAASFARHAGKVLAAQKHPFPLPDDEQGRTDRRAIMLDHELRRLSFLHAWRELALLARPLPVVSER